MPDIDAARDEEERYLDYLREQCAPSDVTESLAFVGGTALVVLWSVMRGLFRHHARLYMLWCLTVTPPALLPGAVALAAPALYHSARGRGREAVIVCSKLLAAALYPLFRLAWHAPGMPLDVQAGVGGRATLPLQPLALAQCGAVLLLFASFRHPLRFKAQMLCQMALLVVVLQAETAARQRALDPRQHFLTYTQTLYIQVLAATILPLLRHLSLDRARRHRCQERLRWQQQQQHRQQGQLQPQPQLWGGLGRPGGAARPRSRSS